MRRATRHKNISPSSCFGRVRRLYQRHEKTWKPTKFYQCEDCDEIFINVSENYLRLELFNRKPL